MIVNQIKGLMKDDFLKLKNEYIDLLNQEDYHIHYLDGLIIKERRDYLMYFKNIYNFPDYYNNKSVDAFVDCMQDLDFWDDKHGFVLIIYNYQHFLNGLDSEREIFVRSLKRIANYLEKECLTTSGGRNRLKSFDVYLVNEDIN